MAHLPKLKGSRVLTVPMWDKTMTPRYFELTCMYFVLLLILWNHEFGAIPKGKVDTLTERVVKFAHGIGMPTVPGEGRS